VRRTLGEILGVFVLLILAYLLLIHSTGFAKDIAALGDFTVRSARTFQGR
jgi:hypothetical protein